ncbi:MAG: GyrI-like domain-containing protein [Pseudobdellovibrio sp.]
MKIDQQESEAFTVIGLTLRTNNAKEMSGAGGIAALWQRVSEEKIADKVLDKVNHNFYAVYHAYESDMNGEYSLTIGVPVKAGASVPEGLSVVHIPQQKYLKIETDQGQMPDIVIKAWQYIWDKSSQSEINRSYTADFEVYDHRCANPLSSQVDLFIAVK